MPKTLTTLLGLFCAALPCKADFGEYESHKVGGGTLTVHSEMGELRVTAIDDAAFEIHYLENGVKQLPSFAISEKDVANIDTRVRETESSLVFEVDGLTAQIDKSPVRISYFKDGEPLVGEEHGYFAYDTVRGFRFSLDDHEKILGGGQRVMGMDRRGHRMPLYNKASYGYEADTDQMYFGLPAVMSNDKYMIIYDNTASGWLDIGSTESDVLKFESVGGRSSYLVIAGDSYPALIENYTDVTGRQPLPPRWAFGNYASRFGYHTEKEARKVVRRFQRADIPLDAIILDIYWFGPDIKGHMGNLDWDRDAWPTPEKMIADFSSAGVKTIVITEPFILSTSQRWQNAVDNNALAKTPTGAPRRFDFYFGNTGLVDVFDTDAQDWFWKPYEVLFEQGTAATWGDLGEPEVHPGDSVHWLSNVAIEATGDEIHNAYGHVWAKMVYEKQVAMYPDMRPLILMRSGFAGSQRYAMVPWTGDVSRSWGGIKPQIELSLQMSMFGLAYNHSDLGGFAGGEAFDKELYIRWLQYGVFQPVYRPHAQEHIAPEPVFHDRETRNIIRDYIKLRYRLLPYNYTLAYENSTTGMPLMRPLFFEDEDNPDLIDEKTAYLWGDAFLIAPVLDAGVSDVNVSLPAGPWFDFWNNKRYEGGQHVDIPVTLETIPVLVRAGSFVPMANDILTTRDYSSDELTLHYYADTSVTEARGQMYEDDGNSRTSLEDGKFELLKFRARQDNDALQFSFTREAADYVGMPADRDITLIVHNWQAPVQSVNVNNIEIPVTKRMPRDGDGATVDDETKTINIRFSWHQPNVTVQINETRNSSTTGKPVVYQVFTRLFGNKDTTNKSWGTLEENGVGKFADFTDAALEGIRELGTTHVWYTGIPHHAVIGDYTAIGVSDDDPDVVKGRAGSPYAIKDYYNVNPDLATDPANRLREFEALIERTHQHGMKVIIDIVPNHVARGYESISKPAHVEDFGARDNTSVEWARDNNFYYVPGQDFSVPKSPPDYAPLGGESHSLADGRFEESPAKWTGNGSRAAQPTFGDWFETVKVNFGVRPDGSYAFDRLPEEARSWSNRQMVEFWANKDVPDSWTKFRDIAEYWLAKGVDGFRYDMAQMVPVEFWSYLNSSIKDINSDAFLLSEIYVPEEYHNYVQLGRMDYLYDKVGFYDVMRAVIEGRESTDALVHVQADVLDIESHMLHFLENHDEQRIASDDFAGDANKARPAMVVSSLISSSPTMLYFGQEVGESGDGDAGFGDPTRTSIFDYWGVPAHQRWMNGGIFDGGQLSDAERELRDFYKRLLRFSNTSSAVTGNYAEIHSYNRAENASTYGDRLFSFVRWSKDEQLIVLSNFSTERRSIDVSLPENVIRKWSLTNGRFQLIEQLYGRNNGELVVDNGRGQFSATLGSHESVVYRLGDVLQ